MKEHVRMTLWEASFNKPVFRKELEKYLSSANEQEKFDALKYCYEKYSDSHPEILLDVFIKFANNSKIQTPLSPEPEEIWN